MEKKCDAIIASPGRIYPADVDQVLAGADVIFDDSLGKRQSEINASLSVIFEKAIKGITKIVAITSDTQAEEIPESDTQTDVVYINNTPNELTITISGTSYKTPEGADIEIKVPANGYAEANFMNVGGMIFARGA